MSLKNSTLVSFQSGYFVTDNLITILANQLELFGGFYSPKKNEYYSPINSSKVGQVVNIKDTRNYTSMPIKRTALEAAFYA
jgi:hypothetical protein